MSAINYNINNLKDELVSICVSHRLDKWLNCWMWENNIHKYYHLIYAEDGHGLHYNDMDGIDIEIGYISNLNKYRIDIKTRYKVHNFWIFDENKWGFVETYVKEIVQMQYDKFQKLNNLINLSSDAYFDREPKNVYEYINTKFRKQKLQNINENR